jgi:uncharacterized membrane protein YhhN
VACDRVVSLFGGDIFLMLPPERWFMWGLVAFLLWHIGYIIGFRVISLVEGTLVPTIFLTLILVVVGLGIFRRLKDGLQSSGKDKMILPLAVYSVVISYMLFSVAYTFLDPAWSTTHAYIVMGGALLFYVSDILNAWERFIFSFINARLFIMSTYHLGQIGLAVRATLHFLS